jgi:ATP-dependent DNA helicase RecG
MDFRALRLLAAEGESERLEFKRSTGERAEIGKTACAMLNGLGGIILVGVRDDGSFVGQPIGSETLNDLTLEWQKLEPPAFPEVEALPLENGHALIRIRVPGGGGPYTYDDRAYMRMNSRTIRMPQHRYQEMLLQRMHAQSRWENQIAGGYAVDDLDAQEIVRTIDESVRRGRLDDPRTRDVSALLTGLELLRDGELTNAAVMLFGHANRLPASFPQSLIRLARFRGIDRTEFIDNKQEFGNAFDVFSMAQRFLRDNLPIAGRIVPGIYERVDEPLYPVEALREALANAICHRDYGIGGGSIGVAIYDDRLEISSTGRLPFGLTPEDLLVPHESRRLNPLMADVFYRCGIIERWGRGTLKILELAERAGLRPPEFEERSGEVIVRFRPGVRQATEPAYGGLSDLQQEIVTVLLHRGAMPLRQLRSVLQRTSSERTLQYNLAALREMGIVELRGERRGARWSLKESSSTGQHR